jgi:transposase-like protein
LPIRLAPCLGKSAGALASRKSRQFKSQVVLEVLSGQNSAAEAARKHKLKPELISRWKDIAMEGLEGLFEGDDQRSRDQGRMAELERMVYLRAFPSRASRPSV